MILPSPKPYFAAMLARHSPCFTLCTDTGLSPSLDAPGISIEIKHGDLHITALGGRNDRLSFRVGGTPPQAAVRQLGAPPRTSDWLAIRAPHRDLHGALRLPQLFQLSWTRRRARHRLRRDLPDLPAPHLDRLSVQADVLSEVLHPPRLLHLETHLTRHHHGERVSVDGDPVGRELRQLRQD